MNKARLAVVFAALLWSFSSLFMRVLSEETWLELNRPVLSPIQIAFWRALFAGLVLTPFVSYKHLKFDKNIIGMICCFAAMSVLYLSAMNAGTAANAILLQNTAPFWVFVISTFLLKQPGPKRSQYAAIIGLFGAFVIILGNTNQDNDINIPNILEISSLALGSGIMYAIVILYLDFLKKNDRYALTQLNLLGTASLVFGYVVIQEICNNASIMPQQISKQQILWIALFGVVQLAIPYCLLAWSLRILTPQEAGAITLIEPVLNPIWAYLIAPDKETPTIFTLIGGSLLLFALAQQYITISIFAKKSKV